MTALTRYDTARRALADAVRVQEEGPAALERDGVGLDAAVEEGVVHYAVPNMPALVGRTSTLGLTQATEPFVARIAQRGVERALAEHPGLARGVNTRGGKITNAAVAQALGYA
mgnify:CR=1 FL=1